MAVDHAPTLGDVVVRRPAAAALFERLGLDYCCGGSQTLEEACARRGLDAATVQVLLDTLGEEEPAAERHDVAGASVADLCDHIVAAHHEPLRRDLPRIAELVATVVRVHGADHAELHDVERLFTGLRADLEQHMDLEESDLFPACRALAAGEAVHDARLLALLADNHAETGDALIALRELCGGYREADAFCGTHRTLLRALLAFERDLHQHVHEENNVLFPRVRAGGAAVR
jgi:regulator of cell morphogenesis and NO signaling